MGCGCNKRNKLAVTSVNEADLEALKKDEEANLRREMESLRAAIHNTQSDTSVAAGSSSG